MNQIEEDTENEKKRYWISLNLATQNLISHIENHKKKQIEKKILAYTCLKCIKSVANST